MSLFLLYCVFATATAITAIYELLLPVMASEPQPVEDKYTIIFVTFLINLLIAPAVFLSCIVPSMGIRFRIALKEGLFPKQP